MTNHEVVVGNIGTVYSGEKSTSAQRAFGTYVRASKLNSGRASGESVIWLKDGEIHKEYIGTNNQQEEDN